MATDRAYVEDNAASRERLRKLLASLSDGDLARPMSAGWTVAGVLGHVAFWDQRVLVLLEEWKRRGPDAVPRALDGADVDWVNDSAKPMLLAVPPRRAADLCLAIAEAVDREVAALPDDLVARNEAAGSPVSLRRAPHRDVHLDEIERALGR